MFEMIYGDNYSIFIESNIGIIEDDYQDFLNKTEKKLQNVFDEIVVDLPGDYLRLDVEIVVKEV